MLSWGEWLPVGGCPQVLLKKFTKDEGLFIRRGAVTGLGEVDPSFKDKIIPTLEAIANDPSSDEQLLASDILELLGGG